MRGESDGKEWLKVLIFLLVGVSLHALLSSQFTPGAGSGTVVGSDSFTRLIRVRELLTDGGWFDHTISRINPPEGLTLHWTRPLDLILLAGSLVLSPLLGFEKGLLWSGILVSPVLHLLTCITLAWAMSPVLSPIRRPVAMVVLLVQPIVLAYALAGRADHHLLLALAYVLALGAFARMVHRPARGSIAVWAGAVGGAGLWISIEFILPLATLFATLAALWVSGWRPAASLGARYCIGLSAAVGVAVLLEHPPSMLTQAEFDRISAPHLVASLLSLGLWSVLRGLPAKNRLGESVGGRLAVAGSGATVAAALWLLAYPGALTNPMATEYPDFVTLVLANIGELQPLFPSSLADLAWLVATLGGALIGLPFAVWKLVSTHDRVDQALWGPICLGLLGFIPLALYQVRFGLWAGLVLGLALAGFLDWAGGRLEGISRPVLRGLVSASVTVSVLIGFLVLGGILRLAWTDPTPSTPVQGLPLCRTSDLLAALDEVPSPDQARNILANPTVGSAIVYHTPHSVVSALYHRDPDGILDGYRILIAETDADIRRLIKERGVQMVILCPAGDLAFYDQSQFPSGTLLHRLIDGQAVPGFLPIEALQAERSGFLIFETVLWP